MINKFSRLRKTCFYQLKETGNAIDLGRYCGELDRFSVMMAGNTAWVRFVSDNTTTSQGYTVFWDVVGTISSNQRDALGKKSCIALFREKGGGEEGSPPLETAKIKLMYFGSQMLNFTNIRW
jgi:hypothetical protein